MGLTWDFAGTDFDNAGCYVFNGRKGREEWIIYIGEYIGKKPKERIDFLISYYVTFPDYLDSYRQNAIRVMIETMEYDRRSKNDIGICIRNSGKNSSATELKVLEKMDLEKCFDSNKISKGMFADPSDLKLFSTAVKEWILLTREYETLKNCILMMKPDDKDLFLSYIKKEKSVDKLSEELFLERGSVVKRLYRIKRNLINEMIPWLREFK